jgi:hypothetical protein
MRSLQKAPQAMDLLPKSLSNCDFKHRRHQSFSLTAVTQRVTQHGMAYNNRHRQPTSLICTFTCFAHIPSFCVLFPHKHVDGRASTNMLRDYGAGEDSTTKIFAPRQWWLSFFSSRVRARKLFFKRRRFLVVFSAAFLSRGYYGLARVHDRRKKRFPNRRLRCSHSARSDSRHMARRNRGRLEI